MEIKKFIKYKGKKYWLSSNLRYFYTDVYNGTGKSGRKKKALHRQIYEDANGKRIPEGYVVHHIDGDFHNNLPENLGIITKTNHNKLHMAEKYKDESFIKRNKEILDEIRPKTKEWHKSKHGLDWHKEHYKKSLEIAKKYKKICLFCGKEYETTRIYKSFFCSKKCGWTYRNNKASPPNKSI